VITTLLEDLARTSYPTIGHLLEEGFVDPGIGSLMGHVPGGVKIAGPAVTVRIADRDAIAMNRALLALRPGDVLVVDMLGDNRHAPVGAVTAAAAIAQGAAAVVVDGVATDVRELREAGLPVFARGTSCLTTKRVRGAGSAVNVPVHCGGVQVNPGDIVLGDDNGLIVLAPEAAREVLPRALAPTRPSPPSWPASRPGNRSNRSLPCNTTGARAATCCATSELGPGMG
jgi:regulator of RNase E activity RraA